MPFIEKALGRFLDIRRRYLRDMLGPVDDLFDGLTAGQRSAEQIRRAANTVAGINGIGSTTSAVAPASGNGTPVKSAVPSTSYVTLER